MRGINELTVNEIIEYLNTESFDSFIPELLKIRIRNIFDLTSEEANRVYYIWKGEYMKPKIKKS